MSESLTTLDTGLGTTYERWALGRFLTNLCVQAGIDSLLEGPGDGMTGIAGLNSLPLGLLGIPVTLVLPRPDQAAFARQVWDCHAPGGPLQIVEAGEAASLPFASGSFDLAWNFNVMPRLPDPQAALAELARVSRRYVLVCVPNRQNYSFGLHRLHHRVSRQPWDHGRIDLMDPRSWEVLFAGAGLRVQGVSWVDCPWWPDIVDAGQLIADFFPPFRSVARKAAPDRRYRWEYPDLPYYQEAAFPQIHRQMERLAFFEFARPAWARRFLQRMFGHHVCVLASKG